MDEIRRLKSLLVKHEKRIRALEARAASTTADSNTPGSANSSMVTDSPASPSVINQQHGENHVTHDTNANVAKTSTEDMAPDEVWASTSPAKLGTIFTLLPSTPHQLRAMINGHYICNMLFSLSLSNIYSFSIGYILYFITS